MNDLPAGQALRDGPLGHPDPRSGNPPRVLRPSRRNLLGIAMTAGGLGASGMLAACADSPGVSRQKPVPGSLRLLAGDVQQLSLQNAQSDLPAGRVRFAFGLLDANNRLIEGVAPRVWLARDQASRAQGPFPGRWLKMTGYDKTGDRSPRSDVTGYYLAEVDVPEPGRWLTLALVQVAAELADAHGAIPVRERVVAQVGTTAPVGPTPVATILGDRRRICTRVPPCPMHYISFDQALKSGKPTVVSFATPLLCESRMCGPVVDEQLLAFEKLGRGKANFVHVEIYPQRDENKPAPLYTTFGFQTDPWVLVIDRAGVIRARFGDGPVAVPEIEAALQPLLS